MRRPQRIAELLREGVIQIVGYELADPRVAGVTITDVRVSDNKRDATVYVTVTGSDAEVREALAALKHAAGFVRRQVGLFLDLPRVPLIQFVRDTVEERAARIDDLLIDLDRERREHAGAEESNIEEGDAPPDTASQTRAND